MPDDAALAELFRAEMDPAAPAAEELPAELGAALAEMLAAARASWPDLDLPTEAFVRDVARRAPPVRLLEHLRSLCAADLYLASACARGNSKAIACFEATHFPGLEAALRDEGTPADVVQEVKQILRERFFVAREDRPPLIATYRGRGSLHAWVRVSGLREVFRVSEAGKRFVSLEDSGLEEAAGGSDPELGFMKRQYRAEFKVAFGAALGALSPRQRNLLRHSYLDQMSIDEIGRLYQVHRATAARWLETARRDLLQKTRSHLMARLGLDAAECDSLLRLIESQLEVSLRSVEF